MTNKIYPMSAYATLDILKGKWKVLILCHLGLADMHHGELRRAIPDISQHALTMALRDLENDLIVEREIFDEKPPRVLYRLTERGRTLRKILIDLSLWGNDWIATKKEEGQEINLIYDDFDGFLGM